MKRLVWLIGAVAGATIGATLLAPRRRRRLHSAERHQPSPTAMAAEALRTGVAPMGGFRDEPEIPGDGDVLQAGDPEVDQLGAAYVGDEVPGGDMSTPDQDGVDEIGRAYGVSEIGEGELRPTFEVLRQRDQRR